jgi:RNA polymerase sigma-70 factor (ECF subfamily)
MTVSSRINDSSSANLRRLLTEAKGGDTESLGRLLETYENYLRLLARTQLDDQVRQRVSPSDVVQETMLEAHCDFPKFRGNSDGEFFAWLRRILVNNLARAVEQHLLTAKRDVRREVSRERINASLDRSATRLEAILADGRPSAESDASLQEHLVHLANALARLSPDHRDVIVMRHLEGVPFATIAERLDRSNGATRMLWLRAIEQLRQMMPDTMHGDSRS